MCHPEAPRDAIPPDVAREEALAPLAGGEEMPGLLALPRALPAPAVLIACDVVGRSPYYEHLAARLADEGFVAFCPEYFFRQPPLPELTLEHAGPRARGLHMPQTIRDLSDACGWLRTRPEVRDDRVGVLGFCMGGTFALVLAAERDDVAPVCFYGYPRGSGQGEHASPAPLDLADRMRGPILGFFGELDETIDPDDVRLLAGRLAERGVEFEYAIHEGAGHGFMRHSAFDPAHEWYGAAVRSWRRTLAFLREQLGADA